MDKNGKVVTVTQDAIEPFGQTVAELRNSWFMMMEAFGQPILDYNKIPEEGHDKKDPLVDTTAPVIEGEEKEEFVDILSDYKKIDWNEFHKEEEAERLRCENEHNANLEPMKKLEDIFRYIHTKYLDHKETQDAIHKAE
jgi:hypothetical protein